MRAAIVLAGGLVQTLLVVIIWPLRRFSVERAALAAAYRSLAQYASGLNAADTAAPDPHVFAATESPLADPQPFARASDVLVFQALLDEAERIRASLAALVTRQHQLLAAHPGCAHQLAEAAARVLFEIAAALEEAREPARGRADVGGARRLRAATVAGRRGGRAARAAARARGALPAS